ncbi:MAG: SSS family solute:Na+ symporter [Polaribacter sp.]|jgi:SSS family solute:Na+ symporter
MSHLNNLDYSIILVYLVLIFFLGIYFTKKASNSVEDFFIGGRSMPWWLLGVSMAATNFSIDTPIAVTNFVASEGIGGVWFMWSSAISAIMVTFFFSKLWRRSEVITDAQIIEERYSGQSAKALRLFKGLYFGVIFNVFIMGWVFLSLSKVMAGITTIDINYILWPTVILVFIYSVASGFYGVVITDFLQYFVALIGSILLAYYSVQHVGGIDTLITQLEGNAQAGPSYLNFLPSFEDNSLLPLSVFLVYILMQWWAHKYSDGGGKHIQRLLSAKNENEAFKGSALFTVLTYIFQIWPWIITALCGIIVFQGISDTEMIYPKMMVEVLPHGLLGLVVVGLVGAFMSTIDTHLNLGASYVVNDIYKRFLVKEQTAKHYIFISRLSMGFLLLIAVIISKNLESVAGAWKFLLTFASGAGLTWVIRWFWWRVNAWTEFSGMIASGITASLIHYFYPDWLYSSKLLVTVFISTIVWVIVTFLTHPVKNEVLIDFVKLVKPGYWGWKNIYQQTDIEPHNFLSNGLKLSALGLIAFFAFNFGIGFLILKNAWFGLALILFGAVIGYKIFDSVESN